MIILKTSCIHGGKPLKVLIVWHLKQRYGISAKTGPQLKARLDEMKCDASQVTKPQGEEEQLLHVSVLCFQEEW